LTVSGVSRVLEGEDLQFILTSLIDSDEKERLVKFLESLEDKGATPIVKGGKKMK
jgi:hypothetical protein